MQKLLDVFIGICFRRCGPEDLPDSRFLLQACIVLYAISSIVFSSIGPGDQTANQPGFPVIIVKGLFDTAYSVFWFALLLTVFNRLQRANQTLTAILGIGVILTIIALPLAVGFYSVPTESPTIAYFTLGLLLLTGWQVTVIGHIVHRALGFPLAGGLAFAILYAVTYFALVWFLFPNLG